MKTVLLRASSTGVSPTVITTASFKSSIRAGVRVRTVLGQARVGTCYRSGSSNPILS